jgi:ElaB/YqjD/DUF883 family membrane-anchored ribosome-binding protein
METHFPIPNRFRKRMARERLAADWHELAGDAELLLDATVDEVNEKTRAARRQLADALARANAPVAAWPREGGQTVAASTWRADTAVREHPYGAMLAAASFGLVAGLLLCVRPSPLTGQGDRAGE